MLVFPLLNGVFYYLLRAPTAEGRPVMDQIEGFRMYMETAEFGSAQHRRRAGNHHRAFRSVAALRGGARRGAAVGRRLLLGAGARLSERSRPDVALPLPLAARRGLVERQLRPLDLLGGCERDQRRDEFDPAELLEFVGVFWRFGRRRGRKRRRGLVGCLAAPGESRASNGHPRPNEVRAEDPETLRDISWVLRTSRRSARE